jgi:hypothetical protein
VAVGIIGLVPGVAGAAFAGSDGVIVFASSRAATTPFCPGPYTSSELFEYNPATSTTTQLTCTGQQDTHPFVSPGGSLVVFASTRSAGVDRLYTVPTANTSGTQGAPTTPTPVSVVPAGSTSLTDDYPSWSPAADGTIVFQRTLNGGTPQLWTENVYNPGSTAAPVFSTPTGFSDTEPVYDPLNASIIAFVRSTGGHQQIFEYDLSTPSTPPVNLSALSPDPVSNDSKPDFAPNAGPGGNGQRIIFESDRACGIDQLYSMHDDGTAQAPVFSTCTSAADENPVYSPQADAVAFDAPGPNSQDVYDETFTVNLQGMATAISTPVDLTNNFATDDQPNWAQTGGPGVDTPEAPMAVLLPAAGLLLGGGVVLVARRRRQSAPATH